MTTTPIHTTDGCPYPWCRAHPGNVPQAHHRVPQAVQRAPTRVETVRRQRMRGLAGNSDVAAAEAALSVALDRLDERNRGDRT